MKYSIVIPTYNHCNDLLKPCIESIISYSDMNDVEICISANGCTDNTFDYFKELEQRIPHVKIVWEDKPLGYAKAINKGIDIATGEYVVLLNNDTAVLPSHTSEWLNRLCAPFEDSDVGITGILSQFDRILDREFLIFFCVMMRRGIFKELGLLDEDFGLGGNEDKEFCYRAEKAGYRLQRVTNMEQKPGDTFITTDFPMWHEGEATMFDKECVNEDLEEHQREIDQILFSKTREAIVLYTRPKVVLKHTYGGLGDNLAQSTLPEIYTNKGYDVYLSVDQEYRNDGVKQLMEMNPFIKGYSSRPVTTNIDLAIYEGKYPFHSHNKNYIARLEEATFGKSFNNYPKIYYTPNYLPEWSDKVFVDFDSVTIQDHDINKFFSVARTKHGSLTIKGIDYTPKDIFEYIDIIFSCKAFLCTYTGSMVLAASINRRNSECYIGQYWIDIIRNGGYCYHFDNTNYINVDNLDDSIINVVNTDRVDNYYLDEFGVIHQIEKQPYSFDYGLERNGYGEKSHYLSFLRLGYLMGAIPDIQYCSSILDIGYGNGDFLRAAQKYFDVVGGMDIVWDYLPEGCVKQESITDTHYDVITFFDALEHFDDMNIIEQLKCKYIVISLPNCKTSDPEWFMKWKHRKPNEHLHHFNELSMYKFLNAKGYRVIRSGFVEDVIRKGAEPQNILTVVAEKING